MTDVFGATQCRMLDMDRVKDDVQNNSPLLNSETQDKISRRLPNVCTGKTYFLVGA